MATQAASASNVRAAAVRSQHAFYVGAALVAAAVVFLGFARTYYLKEFFGTRPLPLLLHIHGVVMTSWLVLLGVQTTLVATHRTHIHRRLGIAGAFLAVAMLVVGYLAAMYAARTDHAPTGISPLAFLVIPLGDLFVFGAVISAAFYYRRRPELHKRLMLVATISILPAAIARWPWSFVYHRPLAFFLVTDLLLVACVVWDYAKTRRIHPAFLSAGLLLVASHPLRLMLARTDAWMAFARWLTGM